jgi:hypothetical protein
MSDTHPRSVDQVGLQFTARVDGRPPESGDPPQGYFRVVGLGYLCETQNLCDILLYESSHQSPRGDFCDSPTGDLRTSAGQVRGLFLVSADRQKRSLPFGGHGRATCSSSCPAQSVSAFQAPRLSPKSDLFLRRARPRPLQGGRGVGRRPNRLTKSPFCRRKKDPFRSSAKSNSRGPTDAYATASRLTAGSVNPSRLQAPGSR